MYSFDDFHKPRNATDASTSRCSFGSATSGTTCISDATVESCTDESIGLKLKHSPCATATSLISQRQRTCRNVGVQGRLHDVCIMASTQLHGLVELKAMAKYHGRSILRRNIPVHWRNQHTELARAFLKELLSEVHANLLVEWRLENHNQQISKRWQMNVKAPLVLPTHDGTHDEFLAMDDFANTLELAAIDKHALEPVRIYSNVSHIEWSDSIRWGGDSLYDPCHDGDIHVVGSCLFRDERPHAPVWSTQTGVPVKPLLSDAHQLRSEVNTRSKTVALGSIKTDSSADDWDSACVKFTCVQIAF